MATTKAFELAQLSAVVTSSGGVSSVSDALDVNGAEILVGTNNSRFAENNLRFMATGASYIDVNTVGQSLNFRVSENSSLDTTAIIIADDGKVTMPNLIGSTTIEYDYAGTYPSATSRVLTLKNTNTTSDTATFGLRTTAGGTGSVAKAIDLINTDGTLVLRTSSNSTGTLAHPFELDNFQLNITPATTSTSTTTGAIITAGGVGIAENLNVGGDVVVTGDLTVEGSQVSLNTTALDVEDKNITLNYHATADTSASADGAGITIQDAVDASNDASIIWDQSDSEFDVSHSMKIAGSVGVTNIVTNKVVKFDGTILDDSNITDTGSKITLGSDTWATGAVVSTSGITSPGSVGTYTYNASGFDYAAGGMRAWSWGSSTARGTYSFIQLKEDGDNQQTALFIDTSGRVGINQGVPTYGLEVNNASASNDGTLYVNAALNGSGNGLVINSNTRTTNDNADLLLKVIDRSNTVALSTTVSGKVGIGTDNPATKLQVSGSSYSRNTVVTDLTIHGGDNVPNPYDGFGVGINFTGRDYGNATRNYGSILSIIEDQSSSAGGGDHGFQSLLSFSTNSGGASNTNPTEKMRIDSLGNVGIGTTSPTGAVSIRKAHPDNGYGTGVDMLDFKAYYPPNYDSETSKASIFVGTSDKHTLNTHGGFLAFKVNSSGYAGVNSATSLVEYMRIEKDGKVGIGTDNPTELLEVYSETASTAIEVSAGRASTTTGEAKIVLRSLHSASGTSYSRSEIASVAVAGGDSDLEFRTTSDSSGPQTHMTISDAGLVGIGTNSLGSKLHVDGAIASSLVVASQENPIRSSSDADNYFTYTPDINLSYLTWDFTSDERIKFHCRPGYGNSGYLRVGNGTDAHILPEGWSGTVSAYMYGWTGNFGSSVKMQTKPLSSSTWTDRVSTTDNGSGQYSQVGSWSTSALTEPYAVRFYFNQGSGVGTSSDRCYIKNLTISNMIDSQIKVNQAIRYHNGNVGVGITYPPTAPLHVTGAADGQAFGGKAVTVSNSFSANAQLEITLGDHQGCYVKVFLTGDWGGHSAVAFLGEYFVQNGADAYAEAGMIIREVDNTSGPVGDYVSSRILDGGPYDSFQIQFKTNHSSGSGNFFGYLNYQVMGYFDAIT